MSETPAGGQLRAFVERIERLEAEIKELNADKSEVYKELRGVGFDVKAVRQCVAKRRLGSAEREERDAIFDMYWEALTGGSRVHVHEEPISSRSADRAASGGKPSIPSPEDGGAKMDEAATSSPDRAAQADISSANSGQAATVPHSSALPTVQADNAGEVAASPSASPAAIPDADVPAFLLKERPSLRPLCQDPTNCAGYGHKTCHACLMASGQSEAA
jgi:uncharacterized protein (UPF0335 family)